MASNLQDLELEREQQLRRMSKGVEVGTSPDPATGEHNRVEGHQIAHEANQRIEKLDALIKAGKA